MSTSLNDRIAKLRYLVHEAHIDPGKIPELALSFKDSQTREAYLTFYADHSLHDTLNFVLHRMPGLYAWHLGGIFPDKIRAEDHEALSLTCKASSEDAPQIVLTFLPGDCIKERLALAWKASGYNIRQASWSFSRFKLHGFTYFGERVFQAYLRQIKRDMKEMLD